MRSVILVSLLCILCTNGVYGIGGLIGIGDTTKQNLRRAAENNEVTQSLENYVNSWWYPANPVLDENTKNTLLHLAAQNGSNKVMEYVLKNSSRADVNARNANHKTPLHLAAESKQDNLLPTMHVMFNVRGKEIKVDAQDNEGNTPLHYAVTSQTSTEDKVELLTDQKASVTIKNKQGKDPLERAIDYVTEDTKSTTGAAIEYLIKKHYPKEKARNLTVPADKPDEVHQIVAPYQVDIPQSLKQVASSLSHLHNHMPASS